MATINWLGGVKRGDWGTAGDWVGGVVPGAADDVIIDAGGRYTITMKNPEAAHSLILDDAKARLDCGSTLTLGGPLALLNGTFVLATSGEIIGGTLSTTHGTFLWAGGVLDGATYDGPLALSTFQSVIVTGGFTAAGANRTGAGVIDISGDNAKFEATGGQTLDNMKVKIGAATNAYNEFDLYDPTDMTPILTLGSHFSIVQKGLFAAISQTSGFSNDGIVNDGTLTAAVAGGRFFVEAFNYTNNGVTNVRNGDTMFMYAIASTNGVDGSIAVTGAGSSLLLGNPGNAGSSLLNLGAISLGAGTSDTLSVSTFTNEGSITVAAGITATPFEFDAASFTNEAGGVISFTGPGETSIQDNGAGPWSNAGTLAFGAGTTGYIGVGAGTWTNSGAITLASGAVVHLGGTFGGGDLAGFANNGGAVLIDGTVSGGGTLHVGVGTGVGAVALESAGVIESLTIADPGAGLRFDGGALEGVTYEGLLDLSAPNAAVSVSGGLTLTGPEGAGPGTIDLTGDGAVMAVVGGETLNNAMLEIGAELETLNPGDETPVLTFGPTFDIVQTGQLASIFDGAGFAADAVVNDGSISAALAGGVFTVTTGNFTNDGAIDVGDGDTFSLSAAVFVNGPGGSITVADSQFSIVNAATFTNNGVITIASGATAHLAYGTGAVWSNAGTIAFEAGSTGYIGTHTLGSLTNSGAITLGAGAALHLGGPLTLAPFANITNSGGLLLIDGTLDSDGLSLAIGTETKAGTLVLDPTGFISAVNFIDNGSGFQFKGGTFEFVTYQGVVDLSAANASLNVLLSLMATGPGGVGPGVINLTGDNSVLTADGAGGTLNFDNATLNIGNNLGYALFDLQTPFNYGNLLTFHSHFNIVQAGLFAQIGDVSGNTSDSMVSDGSITATLAGGQFYISGRMNFVNNGAMISGNGDQLHFQTTGVTNNGTFTVSGGAAMDLSTDSFTNLKRSVLTGGVYELDAGGTLQLYQGRTIVTDNAIIILSGAGSTIQSLGGTSTEVVIDSTLQTIGSAGRLELLGGRNWSSSQIFSNAGTLELGGGTFSVANLSGSAGSSLTGFGVVYAALSEAGSATALGGTLDLTQAVSGTGILNIAAGATMRIDASVGAGLSAAFAGADATLALGSPAAFAATIGGFAQGETIDLLLTAATSATMGADDTLVISNGNDAVAKLQLTGTYAGDTFSAISDNHGGTDIIVATMPAASPQALVAAMAGLATAPAAAAQPIAQGSPGVILSNLQAPHG